MPRCLHPNVALLNEKAQRALRALAHGDAFALPLAAKDGGVPVIRRRPKGDKITGDFPQSIWTKLVSLSLVAPCSNPCEWCLTQVGRATAKALAPAKRKRKSRAVPSKCGEALGAGDKPLINEKESPLSWLSHRKGRDGKPMVSTAQFTAGERLRRDFSRASLNPRVTMEWSMALSASANRRNGIGPNAVMMSDASAAARERVNAALAAVGPELASILVDVCCHLKGLEVSEQQAGWPQRSGKVILLLALSSLARHYGLKEPENAREGSRPCDVRHWGQDGYRPTLA